MKHFIGVAVFLSVLSTSFAVYADNVERVVVVTPSATDTAFPESRGAWKRVKKALGFENMRINRAKKAGQITQAQAKPLFMKVTAGIRQINVFFRLNNRTGLTLDQENQIMAMCLDARKAIDAVLGPADPPFAP